MANVNVTLRRYNGNWETKLFPKTTVDQITDLSTVGTSLLNKENPTVDSFIRINQNGSVDYLTAAQLKSAEDGIDAADAVHQHSIADITNTTALGGDDVSLQDKLNAKANLSDGKIVSSEIPEFLFSGMRFIRTATSADDMTILLAAINGTSDKEKKGGYFVATADFTLVPGTNTALTVEYGDDGDEVGASVLVEKGDWIVYAGNNDFAIVNNTYRLATTGSNGIVRLSLGTNTLRSQLQTESNGEYVMDEKAVRTVIKDLFYQSTTPASAQTGDLWFEGTFA
jgi:hypothetical protein